MAFSHIGASGTGASSTAGSSFTLATATNSFSAGDVGILRVSTDNISTTDGNTNDHTSVTGWTGTVTKLGERTNTVGGAGGDGACVSLWLLEASGTINTGTTLTINLSGNATDKAAALNKFTKAASTTAGVLGPVTAGGADASTNPGSQAIAGLTSASRLYARSIAVEGNSTTNLTNSTNFTTLATVRSRNNASAIYTAGEFRINTSAGETSTPGLPTISDSASVFAAVQEYADVTFPLSFNGSLPSNVYLARNGAANYVNSSGTLVSASAGTARFDYLVNGVYTAGTPALLVEPAATNIISAGEDLSTWSIARASITANAAAGPDGNTTADKIIPDTSASNHPVSKSTVGASLTNSQPGVVSEFFKAAGYNYGVLRLSDNAGVSYTVVADLTNGTITSTNSSGSPSGTFSGVHDYGGGWYRVYCGFTITDGSTCTVGVSASNTGTPGSYLNGFPIITCNGTDGVYAVGAQLEPGSLPTSYIASPSGATSRVADTVSFAIPSGTTSLLYTFDDSSTQTVSVSAGVYTIPTTLNRARIRTISAVATHSTTGALTGQIGSIAGTAAHIAIHGTSGALTGQLGSVSGTAQHNVPHPTSGALAGQIGSVAGVAAHIAVHAASGSLTGQGTTLAGSAARFRAFAASGALTGQGSTVAGSAAWFRAMATSGALVGQGSVVAGSAVHGVPHDATGALTGPGAALAGVSARFRAFAASGDLTGAGSALEGTAARTTPAVVHETSGSLSGSGAMIAALAEWIAVVRTFRAVRGTVSTTLKRDAETTPSRRSTTSPRGGRSTRSRR